MSKNINFCRHRTTGALFPWTPQTQRIAREQSFLEPIIGTLEDILAKDSAGAKQEVVHNIVETQVSEVKKLRSKKKALQYSLDNFAMSLDINDMTLGEMKKEMLIALGDSSEETEEDEE